MQTALHSYSIHCCTSSTRDTFSKVTEEKQSWKARSRPIVTVKAIAFLSRYVFRVDNFKERRIDTAHPNKTAVSNRRSLEGNKGVRKHLTIQLAPALPALRLGRPFTGRSAPQVCLKAHCPLPNRPATC